MSGHGHVIPNEDGSMARCGGPGICAECSVEYARENKFGMSRILSREELEKIYPDKSKDGSSDI